MLFLRLFQHLLALNIQHDLALVLEDEILVMTDNPHSDRSSIRLLLDDNISEHHRILLLEIARALPENRTQESVDQRDDAGNDSSGAPVQSDSQAENQSCHGGQNDQGHVFEEIVKLWRDGESDLIGR